jgi:hypothetical protein
MYPQGERKENEIMTWNDRQSGAPQGSGNEGGGGRSVNTKLIEPFYIKKTEDGQEPIRSTIIFLDDAWFEFWAHKPVINGQRVFQRYACMQGVYEDTRCVWCLSGDGEDKDREPFLARVCTVVEEWTPSDGGETRYYRKPFFVRISKKGEDAYDILKGEQDLRGGLAGCRFSVVSSFLGQEEMVEHYGKMVLKDRKYWWTSPRNNKTYAKEPINYMEAFKPLRHNEVAQMLGAQWPPGEPGQAPPPQDSQASTSSQTPPESAPKAPAEPQQGGDNQSDESGTINAPNNPPDPPVDPPLIDRPGMATPEERNSVWFAYCDHKGWDPKKPPQVAKENFFDYIHMVTGLEEMRDRGLWTKDTVVMLLDDIKALKARANAKPDETGNLPI